MSQAPSARRIVVLGGTGFVGRALAARCAARDAGWQLVVPTRRRAQGRPLTLLPQVTLVQADVHDERALAAALQGADALVHLVAILHGSETEFQRVHVDLPRRVAAAARAAGVGRVLHVSALGVASDAPSMYLRSKAAGEAVWRESGLAPTVLRPSVIFGAEDRFLNLFAQLQSLFPVMPLAGATARFQPVWVEDVAEAIVRCLERPDTAGQTYEAAGPQVLTLAELVRLAGARAGHARPVLPLPMALGRLQAAVLERMPGGPLMSRDNLDSMRVPNVASGSLPGLDALGIVPQTIAGAAQIEGARAAHDRDLNDWRARAHGR